MDKHKIHIVAIVVLCMMALSYVLLIYPTLLTITAINSCNQRTIDANHNGISDYLDPIQSVVAGGFCGDGICQADENSASCPVDCSATGYCGDGICQSTENNASCPVDCSATGYCGDGICQSTENNASCPGDCGGYVGYFN